MGQKIFAAVMVLLCLIYVWGMGWIAYGFLTSGTPVGIGLGLALIVLIGLSLWVLWREVRFGLDTQRLARAARADGFFDRVTEDELKSFPAAKRDVEADPEAWQPWLRLSLAYEAKRDRRNARMAMREAAKRHRD